MKELTDYKKLRAIQANQTLAQIDARYNNKLSHFLNNKSMNTVTLIGFTGKDAECFNDPRYSKFTLATEERYLDKNNQWQSRTDWHKIVVWNRSLIDSKCETIRKGHRLIICGKLRNSEWKDKDGTSKSEVYIEASQIEWIVNNK